MPRVRPLEVNALLPLVKEDWESPESLVEALIQKLDEARASRTSYVAVMRIGSKDQGFNTGIGPYPGATSARNALEKHPALGMATAALVVPILTPEGYEKQLKALDEPKGCK